MSDQDRNILLSIGMEQKVADDIVNSKVTRKIVETVQEAGLENGCDKATGNLLYMLATKFTSRAPENRRLIARYVAEKKIKTIVQLEAALKFIRSKGDNVDIGEFERSSGVGVEVTPEQVVSTVAKYIDDRKSQILEERYGYNLGWLLGEIKKAIPFADGKFVKDEYERQIEALLGPRTENSVKPSKPKKKEEPAKATETIVLAEDNLEGGFFARDMGVAKNSDDLIRKHLQETGGMMITRFPPEPNGFLHIGHAKAMNFNFGLAKKNNGRCILRYDDTNPEKERDVYIKSIEENARWMGWEPYAVTFSSDYFDQLYQFAVQLIRMDKAYVDHQTPDDIAKYREEMLDSPWRNRPIEESLRLFEDMRKGKIDEGKATLRMKGDMKHPNPCMRDLVFYRVKFLPHPHAGDKWCVYPSYDFTHCLVDSLENITHSLCTLEFEVRRESYFWLLDVLHLWKPIVWEYSRLNITYNVLSKRILQQLVEEAIVSGWDDPRLLTINGLRRRGYSRRAIHDFCERIGVTRNENYIPIRLLEHCARVDLDANAPRSMVVLNPLRVVVENYDANKVEEISVPNFPKDREKGNHNVRFSRVLYIERTDFRDQDEKDYFGLAPNKTVNLKYTYNVKCTNVIRDHAGKVVELRVEIDHTPGLKPKGHIHWVAQPRPGVEPAVAEVRNYDRLFTTEIVENKKWREQLNVNSKVVFPNALLDSHLSGARPGDVFQFERLGFYCVDPDSTEQRLVFNRTVHLNESFPRDGPASNPN